MGLPLIGGLFKAGIAAGSLVAGALKQNKSDKLLEQAMRMKQQGWDARAPLRARTLDMANQPMAGREDLSSVFADPGNPYARTIARPPPMPAGPDKYQQQAQDIGDKQFAGELAALRRSQGGGVGDRLAADALLKYVQQNPNSQWGVGGPNALTTATPVAPVPGTPGLLKQAMARRRPHLGRF